MKLLCVGDTSLDTYSSQNKSFFGGCSLNVARQLLQKIGYKKVGLYCPLGTDDNSKEASTFIESLGLEARFKILEGDCPRQPIHIDETGDRQLRDYHAGVLPQFTCSDIGNFYLSQWQMLLFPYYSQVEAMVSSLFQLELDCLLACDFGNLSDYDGNLTHVRNLLSKLNYAQFSSESPSDERETYFKNETLDRNLIIADTHAQNGASIYKQGIKYFCKAPNVLQVADTTGAGDAFFAHFIYKSYVESKTIEEALQYALNGGSAQVSHLGPGPELI